MYRPQISFTVKANSLQEARRLALRKVKNSEIVRITRLTGDAIPGVDHVFSATISYPGTINGRDGE